jgi:hypothetical protein
MVVAVGIGSPREESDFFGTMISTAVQKFQRKWNIIATGSPSTTGFGAVGPKTLQKLTQLLGL